VSERKREEQETYALLPASLNLLQRQEKGDDSDADTGDGEVDPDCSSGRISNKEECGKGELGAQHHLQLTFCAITPPRIGPTPFPIMMVISVMPVKARGVSVSKDRKGRGGESAP
jgi:hypothetical protein